MMAVLFSKKDTDLKLDRIDFEYDKFTTKTSGDNVAYPFYASNYGDKVAIIEDIISKCLPYVPDTVTSAVLQSTQSSVIGKVRADTNHMHLDERLDISGRVEFDISEPDRKIFSNMRRFALVIPEDSTETIKCVFEAFRKAGANCVTFDWYDSDYPCFVFPANGRSIYVIIQTRSSFKEPDRNLKVITSGMRAIGFPTANEIFKIDK